MKENYVNSFNKKRKKGATLVEVSAGLVVMSLVFAGIATMFSENSDQRNSKAAADKMTQVHEAAKGYIKSNFSSLMEETDSGPVTIDAGRLRMSEQPPANSLQRDGFLPSSFVDTNPYGQHHSVIIRKTGTAPNQTLEAIVTTYGGRKIPEAQLGKVASFVGASGGYVSDTNVNSSDQGRIVGNFGGWRSNVSDWSSAGSKAPAPGTVQTTLAFDNGNLLTDYLYRHKVEGNPDANRMFTDIDMGGDNGLNNVKSVNNLETITGRPDAARGNQQFVNFNSTSVNLVDVWASGNVTANNVNARGAISAVGDIRTDNNVIAARNIVAGEDIEGRDVTARRNLAVRGNSTMDGTLAVNDNANFNAQAKVAVLNISDTFLVDDTVLGNGRLENDYTGIRLKDLLPRNVNQYSYRVSDTIDPVTGRMEDTVLKPRCGPRGTPRIMLYRQSDTAGDRVDADNRYEILSTVSAESTTFLGQDAWRVSWSGTDKPPRDPLSPTERIDRSVVAQTSCSYEYGTG